RLSIPEGGDHDLCVHPSCGNSRLSVSHWTGRRHRTQVSPLTNLKTFCRLPADGRNGSPRWRITGNPEVISSGLVPTNAVLFTGLADVLCRICFVSFPLWEFAVRLPATHSIHSF